MNWSMRHLSPTEKGVMVAVYSALIVISNQYAHFHCRNLRVILRAEAVGTCLLSKNLPGTTIYGNFMGLNQLPAPGLALRLALKNS